MFAVLYLEVLDVISPNGLRFLCLPVDSLLQNEQYQVDRQFGRQYTQLGGLLDAQQAATATQVNVERVRKPRYSRYKHISLSRQHCPCKVVLNALL